MHPRAVILGYLYIYLCVQPNDHVQRLLDAANPLLILKFWPFADGEITKYHGQNAIVS